MIHGEARIANIVLDVGSYHTFAGESGLQNPRFCSHSYLVQPNLHKKQQYSAGQQNLDSENTNKQIVSIFEDMGPQGKVNSFHFNIDKFDKFVDTILIDNLELDSCSISLLIAQDMSVELQPSQILKQRRKILDYLFQGMQISNIAFIKKPVLSAFALGRSTATVLDSGHSFSHCSIIQDGYCVYNQTVRFGGSLVHSLIRSQIDQKSKQGKNWKIALENSNQSFKQSDVKFHRLVQLQKIIRKFPVIPLKSTMVSQDFQVIYTLPDGQDIKINRSQLADPFVNFPVFWQKFFKNCQNLPKYLDNRSFYKIINSFRGLENFIYDTISQYMITLDHKNHTCFPSSNENRKKLNQLSEQDLLNNVILSGGNLCFSDFSYKISQGIRKRQGNIVECPIQFNKDSEGNNCSNKNSLSWIGGSIVSSTEIMNHFWIKLNEWKQLGSILATSKSLSNELTKSSHASQLEQQIKRSKKLQLITKKCA